MKSLILLLTLTFSACFANNAEQVSTTEKTTDAATQKPTKGLTKAYFASGCFWCVEAVFESVEGVGEVISGYAGGSADQANYRDVSNGSTDHAEAVEVYYDSAKISYETLLVVFFGSHDPTTLNRQGPDKGRQYRSTIFYQNETELAAAKKAIADYTANGTFDGEITTTLEPLEVFYAAEDYHQDYEARNPNQPYVRSVSVPRLKRFQAKHKELLKKSGH